MAGAIGCSVLILLLASPAQSSELTKWTDVIRQQPYHDSSGMSENLTTIRRWVLLSDAWCAESDRHILFDKRARFLSWMSDLETDPETQLKLNQLRQSLVSEGRVEQWLPGSDGTLGYPFALACDQPHVDLPTALDRLSGKNQGDRLWGTWDGMTAGSADNPVSLYELVKQVWNHRQKDFETPISSIGFEQFLAQLLVESGAVKQARSAVDAVGILQLRQQVLDDCDLDARFYEHRMAQVDCASRLYVLLRRNLEPMFEERFGHLPDDKRQALFGRLLMQSYHSGIGNMEALLLSEEQGKAAAFFAQQHESYSARDISTGMIYHNMGREPWGWESLAYLIDIDIVSEYLCDSGRFETCAAK